MKRSKFSLVILPSITIAAPALLANGTGAGSSLGLMEGSSAPLWRSCESHVNRGLGVLRIRNEPDTLPLSPLPPQQRLRAHPQSISCSPCFRFQPFQHHGIIKGESLHSHSR